MTREEYAAALASAREWVEERVGWRALETAPERYRKDVAESLARYVEKPVKLYATNWKNRIAIMEAIVAGAHVVADIGLQGGIYPSQEEQWGGPQWSNRKVKAPHRVVWLRPAASDEDLI